MQAEWLLSDDAIARQLGESLGLEIHGWIGLLLWAVAVGHIKSESEALNSLNALEGSSLWISDRVVIRRVKPFTRYIRHERSLFPF
jgi:predicted nucleic acid-binding protein